MDALKRGGVEEHFFFRESSAHTVRSRGHVVDDQPEHVVLDEEAVVGRLQHEALHERLGRVVVGLEEEEKQG